MMTIENAEITGTLLGYGEHGILTFSIGLKGSGWGVNYGSRALDGYIKKEGERKPNHAAMSVIPEILKVVGVRKWEDLKGKYVRVETNGLGRTVTKIGNLIDDVWLDLDEFFNT
ncbi:hypothetical protein EQ871_17040 [Enterococcus casseliflavus]|jgi:hypothetical protein|uniref:hypothetical protein n=1 Tax=Enterococcus casseliflavus TaxID=37734 RepID=UPI000FFBB597|nr:hypothetical protein [Enterococcus casseliflavus]RXA58454.1 hypothetical protein EQ871_17040 [Enterococcus casseliflavus]